VRKQGIPSYSGESYSFFSLLSQHVYSQASGDTACTEQIRGTVLDTIRLNKYYDTKEQKAIWGMDG